jgi:ABC-type sugar transport system permease subunit
MLKLFNKKIFAFFILLFCTLLLLVFTILPLVQKINHTIKIYYPLLQPDTPTIYLYNHGLQLHGELPKTIVLENGVKVFFDFQVNDTLITNSPVGSIFIGEDAIKIKTRSEVKGIRCDEINIDKEPLIIEPLKVKSLVNRLLSIILVIISLIFTGFVLALLYLLAIISAGLGLMIDTFRDGPNSFTFYLNLSSVILLAFIVSNVLFSIKAFLHLKLFLVVYLLSIIAVSYSIISFQNKKL